MRSRTGRRLGRYQVIQWVASRSPRTELLTSSAQLLATSIADSYMAEVSKKDKSMNSNSRILQPFAILVIVLSSYTTVESPVAIASTVRKDHLVMSRAEYLDRTKAIWAAQMVGQLTGLLFEHKPASVLRNTPFVHGKGFAETDDDYYYEMVAIRAFEKYGINLTVEQLGAQWLEIAQAHMVPVEKRLRCLSAG